MSFNTMQCNAMQCHVTQRKRNAEQRDDREQTLLVSRHMKHRNTIFITAFER